MDVHFSSKSNEWATPQDLFDRLNAEFGFTLDAAALPHNTKCERFFTPDQDGLSQFWAGRVWCNPPYGREIGKWVGHAAESARLLAEVVVMLIPARTDTIYWHRHIWDGKNHCPRPGVEVRFLPGRVYFLDGNGARSEPAPFPSSVIVFRGHSA